MDLILSGPYNPLLRCGQLYLGSKNHVSKRFDYGPDRLNTTSLAHQCCLEVQSSTRIVCTETTRKRTTRVFLLGWYPVVMFVNQPKPSYFYGFS